MTEHETRSESRHEPVFELHFGPRALVRSRLRAADGTIHETGSKGRDVRWQQGAIAVCILVVFSRLKAIEGNPETPVLEGERGSPARSIDNLLTRPGDWALNMFGERDGMPLIRDYIYRSRTVSRTNPVSALQWDAAHLAPERIRIWQEGREIPEADALKALLRVLLEEFNPRRAEGEWRRLFPEESSVEAGDGESPMMAVASSEDGHRPWLLLLLLFAGVAIGFYLLGKSRPPVVGVPPEQAAASSGVVAQFIELMNAGAYEEAYGLTTEAYQQEVSLAGFALAHGGQRFNFPRIAGNPYRNRVDRRVHEYRVTLYVETGVRHIPALEGLARLPVTEIGSYAVGIEALTQELEAAGVEAAYIRQLQKERLERADASRYIQLVCGLSNEEMDALFPTRMTVTLDLTYLFELVRESEDPGSWRIHTLADAGDRLVAF